MDKQQLLAFNARNIAEFRSKIDRRMPVVALSLRR